MTGRRRIALPAWLRRPGLRMVIRALESAGGTARFVGGAVRAALRREPPGDIDIATDLVPLRVMAALRRAGLRAIPTGLKHGTVTAVVGGEHVEITTLRVDVETFGRHARVAFTGNWHADAARRDLTINAIYAGPDGLVFDTVGGIADLAAGRVRFVGDAHRRVAEDALRILRFFRFHARYGRGEPDEAAMAASHDAAALVGGLSGERISGEMFRILALPDPAPALALMAQACVLQYVIPVPFDVDRLQRLVKLEDIHGLSDPLRRLAALLPRDSAVALSVAGRWRLSNQQRADLVAFAQAPPPLDDALAVRRAAYRIGIERTRAHVLLAAADGAGGDVAAALAVLDAWSSPVLPVRGDDVMALGVTRGPAIGKLLHAVEAWWIDQNFSASRTESLARLRELAKKTV